MPPTTVLATPGWRLEFHRHNDRWGHAVCRGTPGGFVELLHSIEGHAGQSWPASPPLQELHVQRTAPAVHAALLLGRAGRSHWSASIAIDEGADAIRFDVACRIHERPVWLGCSYRLCQAWTAAEEGLMLAGIVRLVAHFIHVENDSKDGSLPKLLLRAPDSHTPYPQTVRWQYALYPTTGQVPGVATADPISGG